MSFKDPHSLALFPMNVLRRCWKWGRYRRHSFALVPVKEFRGRASEYYDDAEPYMEAQWNSLVWPEIQNFNFDVTLDFAAGHGRNTSMLARHARKLYSVDAN